MATPSRASFGDKHGLLMLCRCRRIAFSSGSLEAIFCLSSRVTSLFCGFLGGLDRASKTFCPNERRFDQRPPSLRYGATGPLGDRQPFAEYAHRILALAESGELTVCVSSLSFSILYYILRKLKGHTDALALLGKFKLLVRVAAVTETEVQSALASDFKDFEDAIQHFAAKAEAGISAIVTRNKADFSAAKVELLDPWE